MALKDLSTSRTDHHIYETLVLASFNMTSDKTKQNVQKLKQNENTIVLCFPKAILAKLEINVK